VVDAREHSARHHISMAVSVRARSRRLPPVLTAAAAVLVLAGCGGAARRDLTPAQRLAEPGRAWSAMSHADQVATMRSCRLEGAVRAAQDGGIHSAPYFSGRYQAVQDVSGTLLRDELTTWFEQASHGNQTLGRGCATVLARLVDVGSLSAQPRADFAAPVTASSKGLRLDVAGSSIRLAARVAPAGARLTVTPAPGRARSGARARVGRAGDVTTVTLDAIPLGISYLQVTVTDGPRRRQELMIVDGRRAETLPAPRTFAPVVISGQGSRGLTLLYLPQAASATVITDGAPLSLAAGGTVLLAHRYDDREAAVAIDAGRYRNVQVTATGKWSVRIVPARAPGSA
jgi:hypothetical protein